ncbi:pentatricopeptide repeat (PPR-like) superfamily protein [Striga asiatica]|uniref:Pentatricopeptide repeat (PPR-like) superfamily protein n=1 Tax=Striga asiatica TaxID=4170 RepID=A0A5A7PHP8_STRAF|nr:pentatricopeptide repeat (PPR-like) superfamily protein [Striga asiatica]
MATLFGSDGYMMQSVINACAGQGAVATEHMANKKYYKCWVVERENYVLLSEAHKSGNVSSRDYVLFSEAHESANRWDEVCLVQKLMSHKGVTNAPGDMTHPCTKAVCAFWNVMEGRLKTESGWKHNNVHCGVVGRKLQTEGIKFAVQRAFGAHEKLTGLEEYLAESSSPTTPESTTSSFPATSGSGGAAFPTGDSATTISTTWTSHSTQFLVAVRWGTSWVTEFLHGGGPPLALRNWPYLVFSLTAPPPPSLTGSHSTELSRRLGGSVCRTFRPVIPSRKGWFDAVRYFP